MPGVLCAMAQPPRRTVYANSKISEKEREKTITFTIASKTVKY